MSVLPFPSTSRRPPDEPRPAPVPTLREALGDVLRDERHNQGRTLTDVADRAGVSVGYLSEIERGRKDVSSDVLTAVTGALDVSLPVVLERTATRLTARARAGMFALAA